MYHLVSNYVTHVQYVQFLSGTKGMISMYYSFMNSLNANSMSNSSGCVAKRMHDLMRVYSTTPYKEPSPTEIYQTAIMILIGSWQSSIFKWKAANRCVMLFKKLWYDIAQMSYVTSLSSNVKMITILLPIRNITNVVRIVL